MDTMMLLVFYGICLTSLNQSDSTESGDLVGLTHGDLLRWFIFMGLGSYQED